MAWGFGGFHPQKPAPSVDDLGSKWEDGAKAMVKVQAKALASV
jgi:hypothetical protein